jgi:hypothetical protein
MKKRHPMQPVVWDGHGVVRFQANPIVDFMLDALSERGISLNELARMSAAKGWTNNDWEQLSQLIGYSVSGFADLSYVRDSTWNRAHARQQRLLAKQPEDPAADRPACSTPPSSPSPSSSPTPPEKP